MFDVMILYGVVAISSLMLWHFHPLLFEVLDTVASLFDAMPGDRKATGAPVPLADDMEALRVEAATSEIGTTRVVPVQPSIGLAVTDASSRKMMQRNR